MRTPIRLKVKAMSGSVVDSELFFKMFIGLKPGSVVKLTKHPKFDVVTIPIYLLRVDQYRKSTRTLNNDNVVAVNLFTGRPWLQSHIKNGIEFEITKERKEEKNDSSNDV